ncbi:hypothetical protein [Vagococcus sp. WN89Y]|uniref:hypothetical protein n=1 Tax=Vagococcus sp. WN89Y TaxID=3457258 RepID=UPI003FCDBCC1
MKTISHPQHVRRVTGEFLARQDRAAGDARQQQDRITELAKYPGRNSQNASQQDLAYSLLNLVTLLSTIRPGPESVTSSELTKTPETQNSLDIDSQHKVRDTYSHFVDNIALPALLSQSQPAHNQNIIKTPKALRHHRSVTLLAEPVKNSAPPLSPTDRISKRSEPETLTEKQNKILDTWLLENNLKPDSNHKFERLNCIARYMAENIIDNTTEIARLLLLASNSYGAEEHEILTDSRKWAVIAEYFHHVILGASLEEWLLKQIQQIKNQENYLYHHENLQRAFTNKLNAFSGGETLSSTSRKFYQNHILINLLPTFMLQPSLEAQAELAKMDISKTQWGLIHAGARLLNYAGSEFRTLNINDLAEIGITLDILIRQGIIPQEYVDFFFLPALIHYASTEESLVARHELIHQNMPQIITRYFEHIAKWANKHNPIAQLSDLVKNWKSRRELAQEILSEKNIPLTLLNSYMNQHSATIYHYPNGASINIPNIDEVFDLQNQKIEKVAREADSIVLPQAFNALSQASQAFIANASINRVTAKFTAEKAIHGVPLSKSVKMGIDHSGALEYPIPDQYDLLQCINDGEERIYILQTQASGEYSIFHANTLREDMFWLLDDIPPGGITDYDLKMTFDRQLKSKEEAPAKLIDKLATLHSSRLRRALEQQGYQKTPDEHLRDFILSLIPFYTCISEAINGDSEAATTACMMDIVSLLPLAGITVKTGFRFGTALAKSTTLALTWSARQATLKTMLKQAGQIYIKQFPDISVTISPSVMQRMGVIFLRGIDPGVELLTQGMLKGTKALEKAISHLQEKGRGLTDLAKSLKKLIRRPVPQMDIKKYSTQTLFSKRHNREVDLAAIGKQSGKQIWVQFNSESGELFGRKYFINSQGMLEPAPYSAKKRFKSLQTEGLGGKGAIKKNWPADRQVAGPSYTNPDALPVFRDSLINNIPVQIRTYGEPGSETLLYPEINEITLLAAPMDIKKYELALSTLLPEEVAALMAWITPGNPTLIHRDGTSEMVDNISIELNKKLIRGLPFTPYEKLTYDNLISAIESKKIPGIQGDYLHVSHYRAGAPNPWLNGELAINDYVTNHPVIMSLSAEPTFALAAIKEAHTISADIASFIFYKIENAKNTFPLISSSFSFPMFENDFLYPPNTVLKIKSITISQPISPENIGHNEISYKANRIGVILTEVDATEAAQISTIKNLFNGVKIPIVVLPAYNTLPALPVNRGYWDRVREVVTAPLIPPPSFLKYSTLQKLEKFIPEIPIQVTADTSIITKNTEEHINKYLSPANWRAYAGLGGDVPPEISWMQRIIRNHCEESLRKLTNVDNILSNISPENIMKTDIGKYLMKLTPTHDKNIVTEAFTKISKVFNRARVFMDAAKKIDYSNFVIVSTELFQVRDARQQYISLLSNEALRKLPKACTHKLDPEARIVIFADQFIGNSPEAEGVRASLTSSSEFKIHQSIIHEVTHLTSLTSDLFTHSIPTPETYYTALFARENFMRALMTAATPGTAAPIWRSSDFLKFMQNVVNYQNVHVSLDYASVIRSIKKDPMLSANIFYSDAEVLALIANDIDAQRSVDTLFRSKRDTRENSFLAGNDDTDMLVFLTFLLDATTNGLIHLTSPESGNKNNKQTLRAIKRKKISGVSMDLQIYGNTNNAALLFPEYNQWTKSKSPEAKKNLKKTIATLSPQEKKALSLWTEFADQHHTVNNITTKPKINKKIINSIRLTPDEKITYDNILTVVRSGKLPAASGDFLRIVHYSKGEKNPWLNDELDVNDYVSTAKAFMSACPDDRYALSEITDLRNPGGNITSIVLYKIENSTRALSLPPLLNAPVNTNNEYLYPPGSLFKVKSLAISVPVSTEAGYKNANIYRAQRVAVTLTEVNPEEAKKITTIKNIFNGAETHFLKASARRHSVDE